MDAIVGNSRFSFSKCSVLAIVAIFLKKKTNRLKKISGKIKWSRLILCNTALRYGAYADLAGISVFLMIYYPGYNPIGASGWLGAWIPVLFIVLGVQYFKKSSQVKEMTYGRVFRLGWNITLPWAFVYAGFAYIFGKTIGQNLLEWHKLEILTAAEQAKMLLSADFYKESMKSLEDTTLGGAALNDFFMKLIGGGISSLVIAAFMKTNAPGNLMEETNE